MRAWRRWPLRVRIFDARARRQWEALRGAADAQAMPCATLEYDIVSGSTGRGGAGPDSPLEAGNVGDSGYQALERLHATVDEMSRAACRIFERARQRGSVCTVCGGACEFPELDSDEAARVYSRLVICPMEGCLHAFHLLCLAKSVQTAETENDVLITRYSCPACRKSVIWGDCIRLQCCILRKTRAGLEAEI